MCTVNCGSKKLWQIDLTADLAKKKRKKQSKLLVKKLW